MANGGGDHEGNLWTVLGTLFGASTLMALGGGISWMLRWWREGRIDQIRMLQNILSDEQQEKKLVEAERDRIRSDFEEKIRVLCSDYESRVAKMATENGRLHVDITRLNGELKLVYTTMQLMGLETLDSLDNVVDIVITSDQEGKIIDVAPSIAFLTGYTRSELVGRSLTMLIPERYRDRHTEGLRQVVATGHAPDPSDVKRYAILTKDHEEIPIDIRIASRFDRETRKWRYTSVIKRSFRPMSDIQ